jgi:Icc-related predicted phosphoesterase
MLNCFFVSDFHGHTVRYEKLINKIIDETPDIVLIGGDIFPSAFASLKTAEILYKDFIADFLYPNLTFLKSKLKDKYPDILLILGNDDGKFEEPEIINGEMNGLFNYIHNKKLTVGKYNFYGYAYVPPTPFLLKDWERYDVSRYVDIGCVPLEEGFYSVPTKENEKLHLTIKDDLKLLAGNDDLSNAVFLFHSPPHNTNLDYADLDGKLVEGVQPDCHVGSIAIRKFIEKKQPLLTLHGHIHESASLTGSWKDVIGKTLCLSAAHDGEELALIKFIPDDIGSVVRELI